MSVQVEGCRAPGGTMVRFGFRVSGGDGADFEAGKVLPLVGTVIGWREGEVANEGNLVHKQYSI